MSLTDLTLFTTTNMGVQRLYICISARELQVKMNDNSSDMKAKINYSYTFHNKLVID